MFWRALLSITLVLLSARALLPEKVSQQDVQDLLKELPEHSWLRSRLAVWVIQHSDMRQGASEEPYLQGMRQEGIKRAYFELSSIWRAGKPQDVRVISRLYFDKYDGPHAQIADQRSIDAIRASGLENLLDRVAIDWAKERPLVYGIEHAIVRHPEGKQMFTKAELFDDIRLSGIAWPWSPWIGSRAPPLADAASVGDANEVARLLQTSKSSQQELNAALLNAVTNDYDNSAVIELLLKAGADINCRDPRYGLTALMWAIGRPIQLPTLIDHGADVNLRDPQGNTALGRAKQANYREAAQILEKGGAKN